ncbi:MAG: hypothetical protein LIO96_14860 [Lachnospiraceae bacterium]|nr:hypothetical protein [Lachnospiraceae bacterium]
MPDTARGEVSWGAWTEKNIGRHANDENADNEIRQLADATVLTCRGMALTRRFFVSLKYDGIVVDTEDVFAVAYGTAYNQKPDIAEEKLVCAIFTNDPAVPVLPMHLTVEKRFVEFMKSKEGRTAVEVLFTKLCPYLTYPVQDLKNLDKQIKRTKAVEGNIEWKKMREYILSAQTESGLFKAKEDFDMPYTVSENTKTLLRRNGYFLEEDVHDKLRFKRKMYRMYEDCVIETFFGEMYNDKIFELEE